MFDASGNLIHFTIVKTTDAAAEPLTAAELKTALKIDVSTDDTLIEAYIKAARQTVEFATRRALINTTYTMTLDSAPTGRGAILLPVAPVSSVTSLKSYATDDTESTVSSSVYRLDASSIPARLVLKDGQSWPTGLRPQNALQVIFVAGYGAASSNITDTGLIQAVRLLATHWYEQREPVADGDMKEVPMAYQSLINPLVVPWL